MSNTIFGDLDKAICDVIEYSWVEYDDAGDIFYGIDPELLRILQSEYNIHFREPDAEQLKAI